jgi:hypothetical protein
MLRGCRDLGKLGAEEVPGEEGEDLHIERSIACIVKIASLPLFCFDGRTLTLIVL